MSEGESQDKGSVMDSAIGQLQLAVDELYLFRDLFFESHSIDEAPRKNELLKQKLEETLQIFDDSKGHADKSSKAYYLYLKARALNVMPEADAVAEESLSKALKLDPALIEAWNELGECLWKRGKSREAKNCFENALKHGSSKVSLRNFSIAVRDEALQAKSVEERHAMIRTGVKFAKDAVALDFDDGTSLAILANAHLAEFFNIAQNPLVLKAALLAYQYAEKDPKAKSTSEFHYNKGIALKYDEDYKQAIESFSLACSLDPTWESASQKLEDLVSYLGKINELVQKKGKVGAKKLQGMLKTLSPTFIGPYSGTFRNVTFSLVPLSDLKPGLNIEKVVLGRVICHVRHDDGVPFIFCITDAQQNTVVVTVYNLAEGKGVIIGDAVAIPEPFYSQVNLTHDEKEYKFGSIRVNTPVMLVVNGKRVPRDCEAGTQLSTFKKPD